MEIPPLAPLFAVRERAGRHHAQLRNFLERLLVANGIFDQVRLVLLDQPAAAERVGEIELLVKVDHPVALAHAVADLLAGGRHETHAFVRIEDVVGNRAADRRVHAKDTGSPLPSPRGPVRAALRPNWRYRRRRLVRRRDRHRPASARPAEPRLVRRRRTGRPERCRITLHVVARGTVQQVIHGQLRRLALDVPQRHVERALRVDLLAPRRIEAVHVHVVPDALDVERALADQAACKILDQVGRAAFADAGDADVGLDGHQHPALVERSVHAGMRPAFHPGDFGFGKRGLGASGRKKRRPRACSKNLEERSAVDHRARLSC